MSNFFNPSCSNMPKSTKMLSVSKTPGEWSLIEKKVAESGKKNLSCYIRGEAIKIKNAFKNDPSSITTAFGERIEKRPSLHTPIYEEMNAIAKIMKVPVSTLVDRFIIDPILVPKL